MADPIITIAQRLKPTFARIGGISEADADAVVRRSDRADAQVNGSLALAKQLGKTPREIAQLVLDEAGITLNKNTVPDDPRSPFVTSGVRIGTPSVTTQGMKRVAVMYQDDGFGTAGLEGVERALGKRGLTLTVAAPYERNTDQVDDAVKTIRASDAQAVIMISVNRSTSAFIRRYREAGGGAQLYNISVVDPAEIVKLAGLKHAHGLGVSQVVPYPFMPAMPVVREYQRLLKQYAPNELVNYTSFEQFLGAKVLVEALRRAGPAPTRAKVVKALESLQSFDLGGITLGYSPTNRIGSRYVEVTVIGSNGRLMK